MGWVCWWYQWYPYFSACRVPWVQAELPRFVRGRRAGSWFHAGGAWDCEAGRDGQWEPFPLGHPRWQKLAWIYLLFHVLVKCSAAPREEECSAGREHVSVDDAGSVLSWNPQKGFLYTTFLCYFMHQRKQVVQTGSLRQQQHNTERIV